MMTVVIEKDGESMNEFSFAQHSLGERAKTLGI
jgi:hypothetical protein